MDRSEIRQAGGGDSMKQVLLYVRAVGGMVSRTDLEDGLALDEMHVGGLVERLLGMGLVSGEVSLAAEVVLTPEGFALAEEIAEGQRSGPDRRAAVQKALLRWLDEAGRSVSTTQEFVGQPAATSAGLQFTDLEVEGAADFLREYGLIKGVDAWTGDGHVVQPEVTHLGREAVDDPRHPIDFVRMGGLTVNAYDHSSRVEFGDNATVGGFQSGGSGNRQENTQVLDGGQQRRVLALLGEMDAEVPGLALNERQRQAVREALAGIRAEVEIDRPMAERVREAVIAGMRKAGEAFAAEGGQMLAQGFTTLLQMIA